MTPQSAVARWLDRRPGRSVVAVSGGADSTALCAALAAELDARRVCPGRRLAICHYNHRLRSDEEHLRDLQHVRALASRFCIPLITGAAASGEIAGAAADAGGIESAARRARHAFFESTCRLCGADTLFTAHTANDQQETVLMRLLAGVTGTLLAGIPEERLTASGVLIGRPFLSTSREEIERFLHALRISWSEDRSNRRTDVRRNRVRLQVLPTVEEYWPAARTDLLRLARSMGAYAREVRERAGGVPVEARPGFAAVDREAFYALDRDARLELLYELFVRARLLSRRDRPSHRFFAPLLGPDPGGKRTLTDSRGVRVRLDGAHLVITGIIVRSGQNGYLRDTG